MDLLSDKKRVAWLSVASNAFLTVAQLIAGLMTGSVSILSEAAHSAVDLVAAGIATFSVHVADRPPDDNHQYGHEKIENMSGVIEGLLIFAAAAWIIYEATDRLLHPVELAYLGPGCLVMAISAVINIVVATLLKRSATANRSVGPLRRMQRTCIRMCIRLWVSSLGFFASPLEDASLRSTSPGWIRSLP
jgi:cation diffusion facilitator family transporter